jgi:hypothetical protein
MLAAGPALQTHLKLGKILSQGLVQFQQSCTNKPQSAIAGLVDYFWEQELPSIVLSTEVSNQYMTSLLTHFKDEESFEPNQASESRLLTLVLRQKFHAILSPALSKSTWIPGKDVYNLWIAILLLIPSDEIFNDADVSTVTLDSFVMNHILYWMVRHSSILSNQMCHSLAILDTKLFLALSTSTQTNSKQWASILREMIAADPALEILVECLEYLSNHGWKSTDIVASSTGVFAKFCIQVAKTAVVEASKKAIHRNHTLDDDDSMSQATPEVEDERTLSTIRFLQFCAGVGTNIVSETLISDDVIQAWCNATCPAEIFTGTPSVEANPVLDTLVKMVLAEKLSHVETTVRVLIQTWRLGGRLWEDQMLPLLLLPDNQDLCSKAVEYAHQELSSEIQVLATQPVFVEEIAWLWTCRAFRLLQLCPDMSCGRRPSYALDLIGMGSATMWTCEPSPFLSRCLLYLVRHVDSSKRWALFAGSESGPYELFVRILVHLSGGGTTALEADRARRRADSSYELLTEIDLGQRKLEVVQSCITQCIEMLKTLLQDSDRSENELGRTIAVFSLLVDAQFAPICPASNPTTSRPKVTVSDVVVGDSVWYTSNPDDHTTREKCTIVKIHTDLPEEVYFTIQLSGENGIQERQTIGERLSKESVDEEAVLGGRQSIFIPVDKLNKSEKLAREELARKIFAQLLTPHADGMHPLCHELYNVLISQCGLVSGKGIGSLHYSVLQQLVHIQNSLRSLLTTSKTMEQHLVPTIFCLGLALGSGMNVPASDYTISLLGIDVVDLLPDLFKHYDDETTEPPAELDIAMATFLTVSVPVATDTTLRNHGFSLLFQVASRLLSQGGDSFDSSDYVALRSIEIGQKASHKYGEGDSILQENEAEAITAFVKAFVTRWTNPNESSSTSFGTQSWTSLPTFQSVMKESLTHRPQLLTNSCRQFIAEMVSSLYCPFKRWYAMRILSVYSDHCRPMFDNDSDDEIINPSTLGRIDEWSKGLLEEEAEELEDDVGVVAEWVCATQMNDIESWHDDDNIDDDIACGRMLSWLSFLGVVDAAASKDSIIRPSFLAYISRCEAVNAMLDLAIVYGNISSGRKYKFDPVVPLAGILSSDSTEKLSKLASLVMYRSVEVFPTLAKSWWEMHCRRKLTVTVQEFVESQVAPKVLKTALESIQHATAFGQMQVKGSAATGEIIATYVQDDLTLSVLIQVPNAFPFRRAEVDCSKTFGVPPARSRRWALMITQMINNQGGTLKDALMLWKANVDKEFEGVEPCPVCYSVLHVKSHKLPNLECNTCHNHFHDECLKEWFKSSNKTACVLCQQPWQGSKII